MPLVATVILQSNKNNWLVLKTVFYLAHGWLIVILTQCLVVFDLVSPSTKKRSGSFLKEALGGTRNVEIWC